MKLAIDIQNIAQIAAKGTTYTFLAIFATAMLVLVYALLTV